MTLEEIIEASVADAERAVRYSKALDYAWLKDWDNLAHGQEPHYLTDLIDKQYNELINGL